MFRNSFSWIEIASVFSFVKKKNNFVVFVDNPKRFFWFFFFFFCLVVFIDLHLSLARRRWSGLTVFVVAACPREVKKGWKFASSRSPRTCSHSTPSLSMPNEEAYQNPLVLYKPTIGVCGPCLGGLVFVILVCLTSLVGLAHACRVLPCHYGALWMTCGCLVFRWFCLLGYRASSSSCLFWSGLVVSCLFLCSLV